MAGTINDYGRRGITMDILLRQRAAIAAGPRRGDTMRVVNKKSNKCDEKIKLTLIKLKVSLP